MTAVLAVFRYIGTCAKGWFELGHRVRGVEEQVAALGADDQTMRDDLKAAIKAGGEGRVKLHERIDAAAESTNERIDSWARQQSDQVTELTGAVIEAIKARAG